MGFLDALRAARSVAPAVWLQFTTAFRIDTDDIYLFFEGNADFSFYMPELRRTWTRGKLIPFKCKGKEAVVDLIPRITSRLNHQWRALFFVDKDLDDILGNVLPAHPYLLETEYYSVENYIVTESMLRIVWTDLFHLTPVDLRLPRILAKFRECLDDFGRNMITVMSVILYYRQNGFRPNLSHIKIKQIVMIDDEFNITLRPDWFEYFKTTTNVLNDPDWTIVSTVQARLASLNHKIYTRGKFEINFFLIYINFVASTVSERASDHARAIIHTQFSSENIVEILAGRDAAPAYLTSFLARSLPSET